MRKIYYILLATLLVCIGCEWKLKPSTEEEETTVVVERYDRIQALYLTTGDFSALQQMNTGYPQQTRTLIEDVLHIGRVNDPMINTKFLSFYQDSLLQMLISDVSREFADMDEINSQFTQGFEHLRKMLPDLQVPEIYAQIGSLDQSVIVGNGLLGISLDKYLGSDYPLYLRPEYGYTDSQRRLMTRSYIVPDGLGFFLLSLYPMPADRELNQLERDLHMGKIQWTVNRAMNRRVFNSLYVRTINQYMKLHPNVTVAQLLGNNDYKSLHP